MIHSREQRLELRRQGVSICSVERWRQDLRNIARPRNVPVQTMATMVGTVPVCKATLEDISKTLRGKSRLSVKQARDRLPDQVKDFAHLFADDMGTNKLPPLRGALDHAIDLRKSDGKASTPPWGPL